MTVDQEISKKLIFMNKITKSRKNVIFLKLFLLMLLCIAGTNFASANVNRISSHANPPTTVTVYFNANGGNSENMPASVSVEYGSMYGDVTGTWNWIASKSGFNFIGWNTAADGSGYFCGPISHCSETTTHTLYAIFEEAHTQDVSLCPDESSVISASSGARQYEWQTTTGLDDASSQKPTLSASALTPGNTYDYVCKLEAPNCIYNYDFNLGNVGFYSDYQWSDTAIVGQDNLYKQRTYGYISDAHNAHPAWFNIRSHNNDGGKFMICNGGALPDDIVWEEAVKVEPNTNYVFSVWAANVFIEDETVAAELQLYVNGASISSVTRVISHSWVKIEAVWNSGSNQFAALQIKNHAIRDEGNDFGLDDIEFYPVDGLYDTITVTVHPEFTPGTISSTGQTINQGAEAATIGNVSSATGGNGNISYQWYEGTHAIEGATSASYKPGSAYTETMGVYTFTRKAKDATCSTTFTTSEGSYVLTTREPDHTVLGLTRTGKEVDCSTMDPTEDKTITEHGKIVTSPRVTRNGKIITEECSTCGIELSITDTVNCVSITLNAAITAGTPTAATLRVYSDAAHNTQVGSDIPATIAGGEITAVASNLNCHTRYYFVLEATETTGTCTFDWADSTRDMSLEKVTTCTVAAARALDGTSDLSHEHLLEGSSNKIDLVFDHQGNDYKVVEINGVCVMRQNMRCNNGPSGANVYNIIENPASFDKSNSNPIIRYPNADFNYVDEFGFLYNYPAALDVSGAPTSFAENYRGICPKGWHLPTESEIITIISGITPDRLSTSCYWNYSGNANTPGNYNETDRNNTGFSMLPVGAWDDGGYKFGTCAFYWTLTQTTPVDANHARGHHFQYNGDGHWPCNSNRYDGYAVRCVRDN